MMLENHRNYNTRQSDIPQVFGVDDILTSVEIPQVLGLKKKTALNSSKT